MAMFNISQLSLRTKSVLLMTLASLIALVFATTVYVTYELITFRSAAESEALSIARIVGLNSVASLTFQDRDAAQETLSSTMGKDSNIIQATLYDQNGELFTSTGMETGRQFIIPPETISEVTHPKMRWQGDTLVVQHPIVMDQEQVGAVQLIMVQPTIMRQFLTYVGMSAVIFLVSIQVAYLFSLFSQRFVTRPILDLQQTMQHVTATKDYSVRADSVSEDELGQLADGFNEMLDQIQRQDKELRAHRELLEENVRRRTQELSEANQNLQQTVEALRLARDKAEAAGQAKMQFLANISHEIRTPMNGLLGIAEILAHSPLSKRQSHLLQALQQSGADLMIIINDLLDFSKLEAGKFSLHVNSFNLHQLIDNCIGMFGPQARSKSLELISIVYPDVPAVIQSDPDRIRQILINLIGNALKFTNSGSVILKVSPAGEERLEFSVKDTGIGIAPEALEKIFSPFTQADETMTRTHGGTGLGLTITQQLVSLLEGTISVESIEEQGTEFIVRIPFMHPDLRPEESPASYKGISVCTYALTPLSRTALENMLARYGLTAVHYDSVQDGPTAQGDAKRIVFIEGSSHAQAEEILIDLRQHELVCHSTVVISPDLSESMDDMLLPGDRVIAKPMRQSDIQQILQEAAGVRLESESDYSELKTTYQARALLVEDNKVNQSVARAALELFGLESIIAENGLDALNLLQTNRFDIIFMDCQMPVMDGYTASKRIREQESLAGNKRRIPIIAMTAHALEKDKKRCFQSGMDGYLPKPFTLDGMGRCLAEWLPDRAEQKKSPVAADKDEAAAATQQEDVLDRSILQSLLEMQNMGSSNLLNTLFDAYTASSQELVQNIENALIQSDWAAIRNHAHTLKSSSHNIGAVNLSRIAREMETSAPKKNVQDMEDLYSELIEEHEKVLLAIARQQEEL